MGPADKDLNFERVQPKKYFCHDVFNDTGQQRKGVAIKEKVKKKLT